MLFACFKDKEILFVVMKIINVEHIFLVPGKGIVSAWVLNPPMFNNNTYTNFKAAYTRYICDGVMLENYLNHKFH